MKPNILFIMADEMRWDCLAAAGNPVIQTPNLDRLARLGVRFDNAYATSPLCVPARAQALTGKSCWQTEVWGLSDRLVPGAPTFAHAASEQGYFTGAVGKMHFNSCNSVGRIHEPHGFQQLVLSEEVLPAGELEKDDYYQYLCANGYGHVGRYTHGKRSPDYGKMGYEAQVSEMPNEHFDTTWTGNETLRMLREHRHEPFLIWSSFVKPHFPCELPGDWELPYAPEDIPFRPSYTSNPDPEAEPFNAYRPLIKTCVNLGWTDETVMRRFAAHYYGNITLIDIQVGRMLDALEEWGLLDNTLIVFSSDHGEHLGERGMVGKLTHYDESIRIPFIVAGPMVRQPGRSDDRPVIHEDLCATFMDAVGADLPPDLAGQSLLPLLRDPAAPGRERVCGIMGGPYHFEPNVAACFIREGDWKYIYQFQDAREKLFNLAADPAELDDRAADPNLLPRREQMNAALAAWLADNSADFLTTPQGRLRRDLRQ